MNPLISFIIPVYNFASYIGDCIYSILAQTYPNIEVIVVNDGSTDNTKEVVDSIAETDVRVKVIHKKNEGVSIARNYGVEVCNGEYVVFVDADDYLAPDYAQYMMLIVKQTGGEFCLSLNCFTRKNETQVDKDFIETYSPEKATAMLLSPRVIVGSWNKIFKKSFLLNNNIKFSSNLFYGEGLRYITTAAQFSSCVGVGRRKIYYYRRNNYSSATSKFDIEKFYNGMESIEQIGRELHFEDKSVWNMWHWHKCQFCMGIVVRMQSSNQINNYKDYYKQNLSYLRKNAFKFLFTRNLPLYNKGILIGTALSPFLMALLDNWRRRKIASKSVSPN